MSTGMRESNEIFIMINEGHSFTICTDLILIPLNGNPISRGKDVSSPKKTKRRDALWRFKVLRFAASYSPMTNPLRVQLFAEEIFEVQHPGK